MLIFWVIIALALPVVIGWLAVRLLNGRAGDLCETISLGYGAGLGLLALGTFYQGILEVPFSRTAAILMSVIVTGGLLALIKFTPAGGGQSPSVSRSMPLERKHWILIAVILAWITFRLVFVLYEGFGRPVMAQDSWWSRNAKFFFYHGFTLDPADEHFFGKGYRMILGYPLLTYLNQVWVSEMIGTYHESLMKAWAPLYFISSAGLVFSAVRKEGGFFPALVAAFFFSSAPLLVYHSVEAYSDLAMGFGVLAGALMLWQYMEGAGRRVLVLSGLLFAMVGFTKSDGIMHLCAAGATLLMFNVIEKRYDWKGIAFFIAPVVFYLLPWVVFRWYYGLGYGHGYGTGVGTADEAGSIMWSAELHFEIWPVFLREMFLSVDHGFIFAFLAFISVLGFKTVFRSNIKYLLLLLALVVSGYLFVFTVTHDYTYVLNRMATNRNLISLTPLAFTAAGIAVVRLFRSMK